MTIEEKMLEWINAAEQMAAQMAEPTWEVILGAARLEGVQGIAYGAFWLIMSVASLFLLRWGWSRYQVSEEPHPYRSNSTRKVEEWLMFVVGPSALIGVISSGFMVENLLDVWNWAAIFWPEVYLAHRVIG